MEWWEILLIVLGVLLFLFILYRIIRTPKKDVDRKDDKNESLSVNKSRETKRREAMSKLGPMSHQQMTNWAALIGWFRKDYENSGFPYDKNLKELWSKARLSKEKTFEEYLENNPDVKEKINNHRYKQIPLSNPSGVLSFLENNNPNHFIYN